MKLSDWSSWQFYSAAFRCVRRAPLEEPRQRKSNPAPIGQRSETGWVSSPTGRRKLHLRGVGDSSCTCSHLSRSPPLICCSSRFSPFFQLHVACLMKQSAFGSVCLWWFWSSICMWGSHSISLFFHGVCILSLSAVLLLSSHCMTSSPPYLFETFCPLAVLLTWCGLYVCGSRCWGSAPTLLLSAIFLHVSCCLQMERGEFSLWWRRVEVMWLLVKEETLFSISWTKHWPLVHNVVRLAVATLYIYMMERENMFTPSPQSLLQTHICPSLCDTCMTIICLLPPPAA